MLILKALWWVEKRHIKSLRMIVEADQGPSTFVHLHSSGV